MPSPEHAVDLFVLLLLIAFPVAVLVRFVRMPYTVALVLAGLGIAFIPGMPEMKLSPELVFAVILPGVLFQGGLNLDFEHLHKHIRPIALLAIPGIVLSTVVTAGVFHLITGLPFQICLLFGALISPTDPISVLAIFKELGVPERLRTLVEGESLFNDGTGVVVFRTLVAVVLGTTTFEVGDTILQLLIAFFGGALLGIILGLLAYRILKSIDDHLLEVMLTLIFAYGSFVLAERIHFGHYHLSGVVCCVVTALFIGNYGKEFGMSDKSRQAVGNFWDSTDFILNSILFLLIGLEIRGVEMEQALWIFIFAGIAAHLVGRAVASYGGGFFVHEVDPSVKLKWAHVLFWGGLKGTIPLALVLTLKDHMDVELYKQFLTTTFGVVLFSLVLQALTMKPLLQKLGLTKSQNDS